MNIRQASSWKSITGRAIIYYYEVLEPVINESFAKISREEMEFDEWFSVQFREQGMRQEGDIYDS